jgi:hypothetical protein
MFSPIVDENSIVYDRFILPENYSDNPEAFLRKNRSRTASSSVTPPAIEPVTPTSSVIEPTPSTTIEPTPSTTMDAIH